MVKKCKLLVNLIEEFQVLGNEIEVLKSNDIFGKIKLNQVTDKNFRKSKFIGIFYQEKNASKV
jgi:hypothetical protein